ncbi:MAG: hypothetical protein ACAI35_07625 [Candidatus Methylacidiphilales bacterium]|nr:hypothetical protein [Candidatus Methylacidiphilales bacterium]
MNFSQHIFCSRGRFPKATRGSALLLVLITTAILSFAVLSLIDLVNMQLEESNLRAHQFRSQLLAESGISISTLPGIEPGDPILEQRPSTDESFKVSLRSESARLNINYILRVNRPDVLKRLFILWKVPEGEADRAAKAFYEWTHPETTSTVPPATAPGVGAESPATPPSPAPTPAAPSPVRQMTRSFSSVAEMAALAEMKRVIKAKPDWAFSFTTWGPGQLDVNEAAPDLISALCNVPLPNAIAFVERRAGSDHIPFTPDDLKFTTVQEAATLLSLPLASTPGIPATANSILAHLTTKPAYRRVVSTGISDNTSRTIEAIVEVSQSAVPASVVEWIEP